MNATCLLTLLVLAAPPATKDAEAKTDAALWGYCPASYILAGKAVLGDPAHKSTHEGLVYHLASAEAKKAFDADPAKYLPQFSDLCTLALGGMYGNRLPAIGTVFEVRDGKLYLFSSQRAKNAYDKDPPGYLAKAHKLYHDPALGGHCPVSYQRDNKAVKGDPKFTARFRYYAYHCADAEAKAAFLKDPMKYVPQYTGTFLKDQTMCAMGVSRRKGFPALPTAFAVIDGKTYFFWDEAAKKEFVANAATLIPQANEAWEELKTAPKKP